MGRYDKIRYWNGSEWKRPEHVHVFVGPFHNIKYIYVYQQGSTANTANHLCQIEVYDNNNNNIAVGKSVTAGGESGIYAENPGNCVKSSLDSSYTETYKNGSWYQSGVRTYFKLDLQGAYNISKIKIWRYYPDNRTYYNTGVEIEDSDGRTTTLHNSSTDGTYSETESGLSLTEWRDLGANDSNSTWPLHVWDGSSWQRKTLNKSVRYGDKEWWCGQDGYGVLGGGSSYNINRNSFNFHAYCTKDYNGDRQVARFGGSGQGWWLLWLADGRMRWTTFFSSHASHSYSSNYIKAYTWANVDASFGTGTGSGSLNFGGTNSTINKIQRHQYSGLSCVFGTWGMLYRDYIRVRGIDANGNYHDTYSYINNYQVKSGAQNNSNMSLSGGCSVSQDTSISWT